MKLSEIGEFAVMERIKKLVGGKIIGSDTAPLKIGGQIYLATCDILLEGRHFLRNYPPEAVGFKAISVNVSDVVASGGRPKFALVSLLLPDLTVSYVDRLYRGIIEACKKYRCRVVGGNITKSDQIGVDVFMLGVTKKFVGREKLRPGQSIFVTGPLGDSRAGYELLQKKKMRLEKFERVLIDRHLKPVIDTKIGDYIGAAAESSLDVSDGLTGDLYRLLGKSRVKINIDSKAIPRSFEFLMFCKKYRHNAVNYALRGGEDYKILFVQKSGASPFQKIGVVEKGNGIYLDGRPLKTQGFDHFK